MSMHHNQSSEQLAKLPDYQYLASKSPRHGRNRKNRKQNPQGASGNCHPFRSFLCRDAYLLHRGARALAIMDADRSADGHFCGPCRPALPLHQAGFLILNQFHSAPGIDFAGRHWRRRNYSFQHRQSRREGAVPERDDGVCLSAS